MVDMRADRRGPPDPRHVGGPSRRRLLSLVVAEPEAREVPGGWGNQVRRLGDGLRRRPP